ncbi:MAG: rhomboid family intramembrane serine protease [Myxococcota bacterium]
MLWGIEIVDAVVFGGGLDAYGVVPRTITGLTGIAAAPFLHGDFAHLASNTIGILLLGGLTLAIGRREFALVTLTGIVIGGLGTWVFGRPAVHIGASGVVFAYLGFLLLRGWYDRRPGPIVLSLLVAWFQGSLLLGMIPGVTPANISWEGHLFGFLAGALVAARSVRIARRDPARLR